MFGSPVVTLFGMFCVFQALKSKKRRFPAIQDQVPGNQISFGMEYSVRTGLISIANALLPSHDFWQEARTLDKLWGGTLKELLHKLAR